MDKLIRSVLENLNEGLDKMYGGLPEQGGFKARTEYEVGMGRMAEAAHCILGSLYKAASKQDDKSREKYWEDMYVRIELEHIEEEMRIIEKVVNEYSRNLYIKMFNEMAESYPENTIEAIPDIMKIAKKLRKTVYKNKKELESNMDDYIKEIYDVAFLSYQVVYELCEGIEKSMRDGFPLQFNAFNYKKLNQVINSLRRSVDRLKRKYSN